MPRSDFSMLKNFHRKKLIPESRMPIMPYWMWTAVWI